MEDNLKLTAVASLGSALSFGLAYCGYPLMLFGTGSLARALWFGALAFAAIFALTLLCAVSISAWHAMKKQAAIATPLAPLIALSLALLVWWRFVDYLSGMP